RDSHTRCTPMSLPCLPLHSLFFLTVPPPSLIYTLSLHDALPISAFDLLTIPDGRRVRAALVEDREADDADVAHVAVLLVRVALRSEEHTSELQSRFDIVCRLLLEKKNNNSNGILSSESYSNFAYS